MGSEPIRKLRLFMEHAQHLRLVDPIERAIRQRSGGREPDRLRDQAAFAEEVTITEYCDHGLLAVGRGDTDLDLAAPDVKDAVGTIPLREDDVFRLVCGNRPAATHRLEK